MSTRLLRPTRPGHARHPRARIAGEPPKTDTHGPEACSVVSHRQFPWTAAWHLREETYRRALVILVNAQQR
jgi:hypothetical protein